MNKKLRQFLSDVSPPGTSVVISTLADVVALDSSRIEELIQHRAFDDLYLLGCVPKEKAIPVGNKRGTRDSDIPKKNYTFFDIDIRKQNPGVTDDEIYIISLDIIEKMKETIFDKWKYVVFSGNGIHIYYIGELVNVDNSTYSAGYTKYATQLQGILGMEVDMQCKNVARISRLPYSYNNKNNAHTKTYIIDSQDVTSNMVELMMTREESFLELGEAISKIKAIPILQLCSQLGIEVTAKNEVVMNGKVSSARVNVDGNYVNRFSGKPGSGDFIDLYQAVYGKSLIESVDDISQKVLYSKIKKGEDDSYKKVERERLKEIRKSMYSIGYSPIDWNTPRLNNSLPLIKPYSYVVIAGETKSGKSTFVFDLSLKNALNGKHVVYYTLEMTKEQMFDNICRSAAGITPSDERHYIENLFYPGDKELVFQKKRNALTSASNLTVIGKSMGQSTTITDILEHVLSIRDIDLLILDNLDKIDGKPGQDEVSRQRYISNILTYFTTEYNIPVILVHHLRKKSGADRGGFRDTDSLSGSSKISHDADLVVFVSRDKDESGEFSDNDTTIRVMETREFSPVTRIIEFKDGTFIDK